MRTGTDVRLTDVVAPDEGTACSPPMLTLSCPWATYQEAMVARVAADCGFFQLG
jgi:hypothetical protein